MADPKILTISGVKVMFPCKPYPSQFSMMDRVIKGLERKQNCLLESPTGSGKSLALLCSALAWQCTLNEKMTRESLGVLESDNCKQCTCGASDAPQKTEYSPGSKPVKGKGSPKESPRRKDHEMSDSDENLDFNDDDDDFKSSGKFNTPKFRQGPGSKRSHVKIEYETEKDPEPAKQCTCTKDSYTGPGKKVKLPKIYFGTRTHKQIAQIVRELGKTEYNDIRMAILGSRDHTCIHPEVSKMKNKGEGCKEMLDGPGCKFNDKAKRVFLSQNQLQEALPGAWDLEDLVSACRPKKACPYFVTRNVVEQANIIFCPYNYLIDPLVRKSMEIYLKDQIVILDEAHNIEDSAREAAGGSITTDQLTQAIQNLQEMLDHNVKFSDHLVWRNLLEKLLEFVEENSGHLEQLDYDHSYKTWSGFDIVVRLKNIGLGPEHLEECKQRLLRISASDEDQQEMTIRNRFNQEVKLKSSSISLIEQLVQTLDYMYRNDMQYVEDYRVAVMKTMQFVPNRDTNNVWMSKNRRGGSRMAVLTMNFWCMNPGVAFSDFTVCRNIILSSGTLSPMSTFSSELGVAFPISLEANHVIEDKQVWVGTIGSGPTGQQLQAVYKSKETWAFQDELGSLIYKICMTVPYGVLCFLPSYRDVEKFVDRWKLTGMWRKLSVRKRILVEPRAADKEHFDNMMKAFYEVVKGDACSDYLVEGDHGEDDSDIDGALFIAVCRGKVSEGMDFADNNARAVITVGIPFPSIKDPQVMLKKAYNDKHRTDRGLLSGMDWYEIQAFRALNQALGRCIRHRKDWGALIMVDDRFVKNPNKYCKSLSKWVRSKVIPYESFPEVERSLSDFTEKMEKEMPVINPDTSFIPCTPGTSRRDSVYSNQSMIGASQGTSPLLNQSGSDKKYSSYFSPPTKKIISPPSNSKQPRKTTVMTYEAAADTVSSLSIQQQLMQVINSSTAPKDKSYYIVLNQGKPNEQTFLIEPNKVGKPSAPPSGPVSGQGQTTPMKNLATGGITSPPPQQQQQLLLVNSPAGPLLAMPQQLLTSPPGSVPLMLGNSNFISPPGVASLGQPGVASLSLPVPGVASLAQLGVPSLGQPGVASFAQLGMTSDPQQIQKTSHGAGTIAPGSTKQMNNVTIDLTSSEKGDNPNRMEQVRVTAPVDLTENPNAELKPAAFPVSEQAGKGGDSVQKTHAELSSNQDRLLEIIQSSTAPKGKPYYVVLNKGTPQEMTCLVEPKKEKQEKQLVEPVMSEKTTDKSSEPNKESSPNKNRFLKFCQLPKIHGSNVPVATVTPQKMETNQSSTSCDHSTEVVEDMDHELDTSELFAPSESEESGVSTKKLEVHEENDTTKTTRRKPLFRKAPAKSVKSEDIVTSDGNGINDVARNAEEKQSDKGNNLTDTNKSIKYGTRSSTYGRVTNPIIAQMKSKRRGSVDTSDDDKKVFKEDSKNSKENSKNNNKDSKHNKEDSKTPKHGPKVLKEIKSPVHGADLNKDDASFVESDEEFLNTRRRGSRKRRSNAQHHLGQKRVKGVVYDADNVANDDELEVSKENKTNDSSVYCVHCGTNWNIGTGYKKSKKKPEFLKCFGTDNKECLNFVSMVTKISPFKPLCSPHGNLNSFVTEDRSTCVQYLQCSDCVKDTSVVGATVVMATSESEYQQGQTWILASTVLVEERESPIHCRAVKIPQKK